MPKEIDHTSLYYLTGYQGEGVLITSKKETVLLADERYFEAAKDQVGYDLVVHEAAGDYLANIKQEVERLALTELSFTSNRITYSLYDRLRQLLDVDLTPREDPIARLRMIKDPEEIRYIDAAVDVSEICLHQLVEEIEIGMTEQCDRVTPGYSDVGERGRARVRTHRRGRRELLQPAPPAVGPANQAGRLPPDRLRCVHR